MGDVLLCCFSYYLHFFGILRITLKVILIKPLRIEFSTPQKILHFGDKSVHEEHIIFIVLLIFVDLYRGLCDGEKEMFWILALYIKPKAPRHSSMNRCFLNLLHIQFLESSIGIKSFASL